MVYSIQYSISPTYIDKKNNTISLLDVDINE